MFELSIFQLRVIISMNPRHSGLGITNRRSFPCEIRQAKEQDLNAVSETSCQHVTVAVADAVQRLAALLPLPSRRCSGYIYIYIL